MNCNSPVTKQPTLHMFCPSLVTIMEEKTEDSAAFDRLQQGHVLVRSQVGQEKMSLVSSFLIDIFGKNVSIYKEECFIPTGGLLLSPLIGSKLFICNLDGTKGESVHLNYIPHSVTLYDNEQYFVTSFKF